jgi:hypothetical protein
LLYKLKLQITKKLTTLGLGVVKTAKIGQKKSASDAGAEGAFMYVVAHRRKREAKAMIEGVRYAHGIL